MKKKDKTRVQEPDHLIARAKYNIKTAKDHDSSSTLIYACLDARLALETYEFLTIKCSVNSDEFNNLIDELKLKNGIQKIGKEIGIIKERTQEFVKATIEAMELTPNNYDFKKSKDLQHKLSVYIHSYHFNNIELAYNSKEMNEVEPLINEVDEFLRSSTFVGTDDIGERKYEIRGIDLKTLNADEMQLLKKVVADFKYPYDKIVTELQAINKKPLTNAKNT